MAGELLPAASDWRKKEHRQALSGGVREKAGERRDEEQAVGTGGGVGFWMDNSPRSKGHTLARGREEGK